MPTPTKKTTRRKAVDPRQAAFFDLLTATLGDCQLTPTPEPAPPTAMTKPGVYDDNQRIRRAINDLISASDLDRFALASRMSQLTGKSISKVQIDSWTGAGRPNAFPLHYLRALIRAADAGSEAESRLLLTIMDDTGWAPIDAPRARLIELGQYAAALLQLVGRAARFQRWGQA